MGKRQLITFGILLFIIIIGLYLRTVSFSSIPPGLNRDEASIGYTAYSLLTTGRDEYGNFLPISFKSFGDWKLPLYIYLDVPFVAVFGLNEFAVRLPSALLGTVSVGFVYFLVNELFSENRKPKKFVRAIAFLAAMLFAISPWHIFMSRNASESNVAVFLVLTSLFLLFKSFKKAIFLPASFLVLSLSLYTYHGNHIFTPLLFIGILVLFWKKLRQSRYFYVSIILFIVSTSFIYSQTLFVADKTKIGGLFLLGDQAQVHTNIELQRNAYGSNLLGRLIHNKGVFLVKTIFHNYLNGFSPQFLFISGGSNKQHNIPGFGNLYTWQVFVIPIALHLLIQRREKATPFLFYWLLISPVAASITRDAPHTNRMMSILPLPDILAAYGLVSILFWLKERKALKIGMLLATIILVGNSILYIDQYFVQFPRLRIKEWGGGYKQLVADLSEVRSQYPEIIMARPNESPYIYYLFYQKLDPTIFRKNVVRYPETAEGFQHVKRLQNISFETIQWKTAVYVPEKLYVDWAEGVPREATQSSTVITPEIIEELELKGVDTSKLRPGSIVTTQLVDIVELADGTPQFFLIETKLN